MLQEFQNHISNKFQNLKEHSFLLACSGGIDSVVLAHLCNSLNLNFTFAHCNFNLRGDESNLDEQFVRDLATTLERNIYVTSFDTKAYMKKHKTSLQIAARELRYDWFSKLMVEENIPALVTAHHADDSLETFIINLSRGTGIEGLTGIPEKTKTISRPLLAFSRTQINSYAKTHNLDWREDKSNAETKYLRNNIRHTIVPNLKELHPTFLANFLQTQNYLNDSFEIVTNEIERLKTNLFIKKENVIAIEINKLHALTPIETYLFHLFQPYGFTDASAIIVLTQAMSGKELHSNTHRLLKDREHLLLQELTTNTSDVYFIKEDILELEHPISLKLEVVSEISDTSAAIIYVDKEALNFPLTVRKWKTGDYFHPFGMKGVKKISKFYKDEKYSLFDKERQWLLCSSDQIVWVICKRADNRFKVSKNTKQILKISVQHD
ncbi:tRNA lysidine(34) synthetase TilS [Cellulophaga baltica]|uniref:tRNA lysidine(34) synthetase TilS n=1 Tax=Cellulophaga TaxID=104264 RepID=UPI001C079DD8|nr:MULTISPECIES: tRNA lysidine(34) synthetase TilS [Cellulophaga]MBU2997533.1 tRNA lysidine(34) synthetase TilS [Cellulophaga baltica]MDO6768928.1 tRNA lysidine(34) synthetase TilS [Cellulophaga sp. 1_MG-2023]